MEPRPPFPRPPQHPRVPEYPPSGNACHPPQQQPFPRVNYCFKNRDGGRCDFNPCRFLHSVPEINHPQGFQSGIPQTFQQPDNRQGVQRSAPEQRNLQPETSSRAPNGSGAVLETDSANRPRIARRLCEDQKERESDAIDLAVNASAPQNGRHLQKRPRVCFQWLYGGHCSYGDRCKYPHETPDGEGTSDYPSQPAKRHNVGMEVAKETRQQGSVSTVSENEKASKDDESGKPVRYLKGRGSRKLPKCITTIYGDWPVVGQLGDWLDG